MKIKPIFAIFTFFLTALVLNSCLKAQKQEFENKDDNHKFTNELVNQSSPYLLQHAHNPVNWYPWGEEAIEKAKKEDKLLIISIGYAACHWCHVMERESFEDEEVAKFMNDNFVAIKVDREERPDVDQIYMDASYLINQSGGWPLNAIALPDGKPVFAGTYFPKDKWMKVLEVFSKGYTEKRDELVKQAENITAGVQEYAYINVKSEEHNVTKEDLEQLYFWWKGNIDFKYGGKTGAPKFPMPNNYNFLLNYYKVVGEEKALEAVKSTLDNMANGGIYDHLGGGFARYSTDTRWKVPHFEKMLYDNGQLVSLYSKAFQLTKDPKYQKVVYETIEFVERELTSPQNGFYSSLDADSEG
ncbi:MAG: DUF255 domain-containing protein, partial [Flammeovirgaceae bacterium]|nr:DUF255 domain-containing protein [Flammeovirgaceae bacterium]